MRPLIFAIAIAAGLALSLVAVEAAPGAALRACSGGGPTTGFAYGDIRASPSIPCRKARQVARRFAVSFGDDRQIRGYTCSGAGESELMFGTCKKGAKTIKFQYGS